MQYDFQSIVNRISRDGWGQDFETQEEADQHLIDNPQELAAHAAVELLSRLTAIARAVGGSIEDDESKIEEPEVPMDGAGFSVGQKLYKYEYGLSVGEYVVIAKDEANRLLVIKCNDFSLEYPPSPKIAEKYDGFVPDIKVALQEAIDKTEERAKAMLANAKKARSEMADGKPLDDYKSA